MGFLWFVRVLGFWLFWALTFRRRFSAFSGAETAPRLF